MQHSFGIITDKWSHDQMVKGLQKHFKFRRVNLSKNLEKKATCKISICETEKNLLMWRSRSVGGVVMHPVGEYRHLHIHSVFCCWRGLSSTFLHLHWMNLLYFAPALCIYWEKKKRKKENCTSPTSLSCSALCLRNNVQTEVLPFSGRQSNMTSMLGILKITCRGFFFLFSRRHDFMSHT